MSSKMVLCAPFVQISGRFVRQKQGRMIHQRPRDCHALLFASRKLARALPRAPFQPHFSQPILRRTERLAERRASATSKGMATFSAAVKSGSRWCRCQTKPTLRLRYSANSSCPSRLKRFPGEVYFTACRSVQRSQQVQKRAFPRAGRTHDRNHFAGVDREINSLERSDFLRTGAERFGKGFGAQDFTAIWERPQMGVVHHGDTRTGLLSPYSSISHNLDAELRAAYVLVFTCN